jgi:cation:H+ antiporter
MDSLAVAIVVFLASAVVVVLAGISLARFGDELAEKTGWGALWVGTILVSIATSLPELITNITAVLIDSPGLALGNVYGADMINIFTISLVAILFGVRNLFDDQTWNTQVLVLVAVAIGVIATTVGATGDIQLGPTSAGGLIIAAAYIGGMKLVYDAGKSDGDAEVESEGDRGSAKSAWLGFGGASLAILVAAPLLAWSADGIAEATGLGASFMGVLAVSIVTTLPEASVTIAAARRGSYGLVIGNIYGSCAFNLFVIPIADVFHTEGPLLGEMGSEHFVAAGSAILLMSIGFLMIRSYQDRLLRWFRGTVYAVPVVYPAALFLVFALSQE